MHLCLREDARLFAVTSASRSLSYHTVPPKPLLLAVVVPFVGVAALMWSARMIGVALAFLAPWALALGLVIWLVTRIAKRRG